MAQQDLQLPHTVSLTDRSTLTVTGVSEVVSFEDTAAELTTDGGSLWVHGEGLRLKDLEGGRLVLTGQVSALIYEQTRPRGGILRRLLG